MLQSCSCFNPQSPLNNCSQIAPTDVNTVKRDSWRDGSAVVARERGLRVIDAAMPLSLAGLTLAQN